jgi:hypothetical protein
MHLDGGYVGDPGKSYKRSDQERAMREEEGFRWDLEKRYIETGKVEALKGPMDAGNRAHVESRRGNRHQFGLDLGCNRVVRVAVSVVGILGPLVCTRGLMAMRLMLTGGMGHSREIMPRGDIVPVVNQRVGDCHVETE